MDNFAK